MTLSFSKATDTQHRITLQSHVLAVGWLYPGAIGGRVAPFTVWTAMVGEGSPIRVTGRSRQGTTLPTVNGAVFGNVFKGRLKLPARVRPDEFISIEADVRRCGVSGQSEWIPLYPPIKVTNLRWSATEARRGDTLDLSADIQGLKDGIEVRFTIYEYDSDGAHDRIVELPAVIDGGRVAVKWAYEYHDDTDDIPTHPEMQRHNRSYAPPEYFFTVSVFGAEYGLAQESQLLTFQDWIELRLFDHDGQPVPNAAYQILTADGTQLQGQLDADGRARVDNVGPGPYQIMYPDYEDLL
jgi:hypothetical protein